jgi:hypothetical protein
VSKLLSTYKIIEEQNLIIIVHKGVMTFSAMINFIETLNNNPDYSNKLNQIVDLNNVKLELNPTDIRNYVLHLENNAKMFGKKRIALITSTPNQVTYTTIFKLAKKELQPLQRVEIFSTTKKAYDFLMLKQTTHLEITKHLKMLNKELED